MRANLSGWESHSAHAKTVVPPAIALAGIRLDNKTASSKTASLESADSNGTEPTAGGSIPAKNMDGSGILKGSTDSDKGNGLPATATVSRNLHPLPPG